MLEQNKDIYQQTADAIIPDWRDRNKNELIISACNCTNKHERDGYISAIMLKYWNKLDSYYYKCRLVTSPEDIHTWLVIAVMYAIERKPWEDPNQSIYGDPNGPDKVINRIIESKRLTFYQQLNRYKRKINGAITSLDTLMEEYKDVFAPSYNEDYSVEYHTLIINYFNTKDYFMAFFIDAIMYEDVMDNNGVSQRKLSSHLRNLDDEYCKYFAQKYMIPLDKVKQSVPYVNNISSYNLKNKIEYSLIRLRHTLKEGV